MKTVIGFLTVLLMVVLCSIYFTPNTSNASLQTISFGANCCIEGYTDPGATVAVYSGGTLVCSCTANSFGFFKCCGVDSNQSYTVTSTYNDCVKRVKGASCANLIYFAGVPANCF